MTIKEFKVQYALGSLSLDALRKLAYSKRTSKKVLTILSTDKDGDIRYYVAHNPSTPTDILKILSTDKDWYIRYKVANNPSTPSELKVQMTQRNKGR